MQTRNVIWIALFAGLLLQPVFAADAPAAKTQAAEVNLDMPPKADIAEPSVTRYENSVAPEIANDKEFVAAMDISELLKTSKTQLKPPCDLGACPVGCVKKTDSCGSGDRCCAVKSITAPCLKCSVQ